jgi:hypothetical protein
MPGVKIDIEKDGERKRQNDCRYVVRVQHYVIDGCQVDNDLLCQLGLESFDSSRYVIDLVVDRKRLRNIVRISPGPNSKWSMANWTGPIDSEGGGQIGWLCRTNLAQSRKIDARI